MSRGRIPESGLLCLLRAQSGTVEFGGRRERLTPEHTCPFRHTAWVNTSDTSSPHNRSLCSCAPPPLLMDALSAARLRSSPLEFALVFAARLVRPRTAAKVDPERCCRRCFEKSAHRFLEGLAGFNDPASLHSCQGHAFLIELLSVPQVPAT